MWKVISVRADENGKEFRVEVSAQYLNDMMDAVKEAATSGATLMKVVKAE
jgi:hypothetical protein